MLRSYAFCAVTFALVTVFTGAAPAQVDTGAISGVVTDSTGAIVPGAQIIITETETNAKVELSSNESGFYSSPALRTGPYQVEVSKQGFQSQKRTGIALRVQDRLELNFNLAVGSTTTELTVSTVAPVLESETSSLGTVVDSKTIDDLPLNGRTFIQLATTVPGTLPSTRSADKDSFISNGARSVQNSYLLDGIDNKNRIVGFDSTTAEALEPVIDAIEEFKVQTSTFSAEFGQSAGGVVNVTMKSGTNHYHGNLFEFLRNSDTDSIPYFQPAGSGEAGLSAEPVRRNIRRTDPQGQDLLLRQLADVAGTERGAADRVGAYGGHPAGNLHHRGQGSADRTTFSRQHHPRGPNRSGSQGAGGAVSAAGPGRPGEQLLL